MKVINEKATWTREAPGYYEWNGWHIFRINSAYGDVQWVIGMPGSPAWGQQDTLRAAKAAVAAYALTARRRQGI